MEPQIGWSHGRSGEGGGIWAGAELHLGTPAQGEHVGPRKNWGWPHGAWGGSQGGGTSKEVREAFERTWAAVRPANLSQIKIFFFPSLSVSWPLPFLFKEKN